MRQFYVRRKDFTHFPFQIYMTREGVEQPLGKGHTFTFQFDPPKDGLIYLHIHIFEDWAREMQARWEISQGDLIRVAAKGMEAWLKNEPIPEDHLGKDMLMIDKNWYPQDADLSPALAFFPYRFQVTSDEPWLDVNQLYATPADDRPPQLEIVEPESSPHKKIVFGFTLDVFPGLLIIGYEQFKHRCAEAGLAIDVVLARLNELPSDISLLFVPKELAEAAREAAPGTRIQVLGELLNNSIYEELIRTLQAEQEPAPVQKA